jgi:diaminopimelate epimerase
VNRAPSVSIADVNGNRLLVVLGAAADEAAASPDSFFEIFGTQASNRIDTVVVGLPKAPDRVVMRIFERDGTESAFCGNGSLALAAVLGHPATIETTHVRVPVVGHSAWARAALPRPAKLPSSRYGESAAYATCGEPHALYLVDRAWRNAPDAIGRYHAPERNCTVIEHTSRDTIRIRTYERGVNAETGSCGTGACAAVAALEARGSPLDGHVRVECPGGTLFLTRHSARILIEAPITLETLH